MAPSTATGLVLEALGISKTFGAVRALDGADLRVGSGEVHGLVGANGSGKSTILKVISGQYQPDAGQVLLDGKPVILKGPADGLARGLAAVSQESSLAPALSAAENVLMGRRLVKHRGVLSMTRSVSRAKEILDMVGYKGSATAPTGSLRPDERQLVEIARALSFDTRFLILDESTSSLTSEEVGSLYTLIERLRATGLSVLFVSHRMAEVLKICDAITVLRDGRTVSSGPAAGYDESSLVTAMTGIEPADREARDQLHLVERTSVRAAADGGLALSGYRTPTMTGTLDLEVPAGQIVGLCSQNQQIRSEILLSLFGMGETTAGSARVDGEPYRPSSISDALGASVGYVSADRRADGFVGDMSINDNFALLATRRRMRATMRRSRHERRTSEAARTRMSIRSSSVEAPVATLSGGNQQKVVLGKWLQVSPRVLLLDEPTRGVDIHSKLEIYATVRAAAQDGMAVLVSSSEDEELIAFCDTIAVLNPRGLVALLDGPRTTTEELTDYGTRD